MKSQYYNTYIYAILNNADYKYYVNKLQRKLVKLRVSLTPTFKE